VWSDARAFDGTVTIQQPQVRRLYGGHSAQELLAVLLADTSPDDYALVRGYWQQEAQQKGRGNFEAFWNESLRSGIVNGSAAAPDRPGKRRPLSARPATLCASPRRKAMIALPGVISSMRAHSPNTRRTRIFSSSRETRNRFIPATATCVTPG